MYSLGRANTKLFDIPDSCNKQKLHKAGYFPELLATNQDIDEGLKPLLRLCRDTVVRRGKTESALVRSLERDSLLLERVERLMTMLSGWPDHRDLGARRRFVLKMVPDGKPRW